MIVRRNQIEWRGFSVKARSFATCSTLRFAYPTDVRTTDPLIAYRSLAARGMVQEDAEQIRAMVELRKLTRTLQDYTPPSHLLGLLRETGDVKSEQVDGKPPATDENINSLVKYLSEEEQAESLDTPKGLLLTGKPGTGKTFLVDLWFEHLPIQAKFRRHYHHLLLMIYRMVWVEAERRRMQAGHVASVMPDRGVGALWERQEVGQGSRDTSTGRAQKSIAQWRKRLRGMPFFRSGSDAPVPVSSLDGTTLDDDANKGMDVIKLAQLERQEDAMAGMGTTLPMHVAAQLFLTHGHLLLLDELQLLDIASATLLRRILTAYWRLGGVVVATSNRVPEDLYANNVQRRSLVAFLGALKERCPVVEVSGRDWRIDRWKDGWDKFAQRGEKDDQSFFFIKGKPDEDRAFQALKNTLIAGRQGRSSVVKVYNRPVIVPESYTREADQPSVAYYTFDQLCDQPLGPADYLTLSSTYEVIILDDIPALDLVRRNQARRLITLIDCLYESRTKVVVRSQVPLTKIFFAREGAQVAAENARRQRRAEQGRPFDDIDASEEEDLLQSAALIQSEVFSEAMQDTEEGFRPNIAAYGPIVEDDIRPQPGRESDRQQKERTGKGSLKNLSIFSGEEERFAYQRAVSRLYEMSHPSWSDVTWRPLVEADRTAWEQSSTPDQPSSHSNVATTNASPTGSKLQFDEADEIGDFADEASYGNVSADQRRRSRVERDQGPPVLSPAHVWGVRDDWGPKAGRWGRGVAGVRDGDEGENSESARERRARLREERLRSSSPKS